MNAHIIERSVPVEIGGETYNLMLTTKAAKEMSKRYGGLDKIGEAFNKEDFVETIDEVIWIIMTLANQQIMIENRGKEKQKTLFTEDDLELLIAPGELADYRDAIFTAFELGMKRNIESEDSEKNVNVG